MKKNYKYFDIAYDSERGHFIYCIYNDKGKLCNYHILEDKLSVQVAKYHDITIDLKEAKKAIAELIKIEEKNSDIGVETIIKALFDYTVVLIIKCFNSSKGRKTSLDYKKIFSNNKELLELYEKILDIRNNQIAHSGDYLNSLVLYFDSLTNHPIDLKYSNIKRLSGKQIIKYEKLNEIVDYILNEVDIIKNKLYEKLIFELKSKGTEHFCLLSKSIDKSSITTTIDVNSYLVSKDFLKK